MEIPENWGSLLTVKIDFARTVDPDLAGKCVLGLRVFFKVSRQYRQGRCHEFFRLAPESHLGICIFVEALQENLIADTVVVWNMTLPGLAQKPVRSTKPTYNISVSRICQGG